MDFFFKSAVNCQLVALCLFMIYVQTYQFKTVCKDMWWYQSSKTAKIIWVTLDGAMHMASLQADFSW